MFNIIWSSIKKLGGWIDGWRFKSKNHFVLWQFLRCVIYSYFINLSTYFLTYYHCGYKLSGAEKFYLLVYNTVTLLWMLRSTYIETLRFKGLYPTNILATKWNSINKLWNRLDGWRFKSKNHFWFAQFLGCILYVYPVLGLPLLFLIYHHCRSLVTGTETIYLSVYNVAITLLMLYGSYRDTLKFKKYNPPN